MRSDAGGGGGGFTSVGAAASGARAPSPSTLHECVTATDSWGVVPRGGDHHSLRCRHSLVAQLEKVARARGVPGGVENRCDARADVRANARADTRAVALAAAPCARAGTCSLFVTRAGLHGLHGQ